MIVLNKLSQVNKESFTHRGLIAIIILVEIISDKWTYVSIYSLFLTSGSVFAGTLEKWGTRKSFRKWQRFIHSPRP